MLNEEEQQRIEPLVADMHQRFGGLATRANVELLLRPLEQDREAMAHVASYVELANKNCIGRVTEVREHPPRQRVRVALPPAPEIEDYKTEYEALRRVLIEDHWYIVCANCTRIAGCAKHHCVGCNVLICEQCTNRADAPHNETLFSLAYYCQRCAAETDMTSDAGVEPAQRVYKLARPGK